MELVMELAGCGPKEAAEALAKHKEIWLAVDSLLTKPVVAGEKYIPKKPEIDTGLTEEQKERCGKGRWLQDQVNAVFSVAHSKTQTQPGPAVEEGSPASLASAGASSSKGLLSLPASQQGADEQRSRPVLQSDSPP